MSGILERVQAALTERYDVAEKVGAGGMATVFRASDRKHDRVVAIKVLRPELAAAVGAERFLQEIKVTAQLQHPHILPLYDSGEADGLLYYVMPFVQGESLGDRLAREGQLALEDALQITREVADGLSFAHAAGVVHRDIKPDNIMLAGEHALIADFGVARAFSSVTDTKITTTGVAIGTPTYMSPEQSAGEENLDGRSDIYSLGCVIYEMLGGGPPFTGPTVQAIIARKSMDSVPRLSILRETVPPHIEQAVMRALARSPADRFPTALKFAESLTLDPAEGHTGPMVARSIDQAPNQSIAVLPFVNMSADPDNEYLSDGVSEELIHGLSKIAGLFVAARTSSFAFKGKQADVRNIGEQLGVRAVLEGSVRRAGNRLRVTAQLIATENGYQLWSDRYDRELTDVFEMQDDISRAIIDTLKVTYLQDESLFGDAPSSFPAYEWYLKGRYAWNKRTEPELRKSVEFIEKAIELDGQFALAHAGLAESFTTMGIYGTLPPGDAFPAARKAATRALELDPNLAEARTALACVEAMNGWDWESAETEFVRAIGTNPRYATARHWYAVNCLAPLGRFTDARRELAVARQLDPLSPAVNATFGLLSYFERMPQAAVKAHRKVLRHDDSFGLAHYFLGQALELLGQYDEAGEAFKAAAARSGETPEILSAMGHARGAAGDESGARECLDRLTGLAVNRYVSPVLIAQVHLGVGDVEATLSRLEEALAVRAAEMVWLGVRPIFDPLRANARFDRILDEVGVAVGRETKPRRAHPSPPGTPVGGMAGESSEL